MNPSSSHTLEPPPDHKGLVTAITIVFAFVFAVAGVFIGVYFRVERVLKCIDRIGGTNTLENDPLIDDTNSIIGSDAMTTLQKQNETGFVHSCPAEAYPMKKQIYERANKTPHTGTQVSSSFFSNTKSLTSLGNRKVNLLKSQKINWTRFASGRPTYDCFTETEPQRSNRYSF